MGDMLTAKALDEANARADKVRQNLEEWRDWNRWCKTMHLEFPSKSAVFCTGGAVSDSGDDAYHPADIDRFEIIDSCVDSLPPDQRSAIHHRYLCAVYRMRDYVAALEEAHAALLGMFLRKGVMW